MRVKSIFKDAYQAVVNSPTLWLPGLLLLGGLHFPRLRQNPGEIFSEAQELYLRWLLKPEEFIWPLLGLLAISLFGFVLVIFAKSYVLNRAARQFQVGWWKESHDLSQGEFFAAVRSKFYPLSKVSIGTTSLLLAGMFFIALWYFSEPQSKVIDIEALTLVFVWLTIISAISVISECFVICYNLRPSKAIALALDLLRTHGLVLLIFVPILSGAYLLSWLIGNGIINLAKVGIEVLHNIEIGIYFYKVANILLWSFYCLWLGILNAFYNLALMRLFKDLVQHPPLTDLTRSKANKTIASQPSHMLK